jgi:hypothetical protein
MAMVNGASFGLRRQATKENYDLVVTLPAIFNVLRTKDTARSQERYGALDRKILLARKKDMARSRHVEGSNNNYFSLLFISLTNTISTQKKTDNDLSNSARWVRQESTCFFKVVR